MTSYVENETGERFDFEIEAVINAVAEEVLKMEGCPYEAQVNVLLTDNKGIREFNAGYRQTDRATDVLSFPNMEFEKPADFAPAKDSFADCFDPESGELVLGDIILSVDKIIEQAENYGHSRKRELAFLTAHSMLHLCGYDHMEEEEARVMEQKQEAVLAKLGISREKQP